MTEPHYQYPQENDRSRGRSNVPIPDPSIMTTAALEREVGHLRELIGGKVDDLEKELNRFKESHANRHADAVDKAIEHLEEVCGVKFEAIQMQFRERDARVEQASSALQTAVEAALLSAKEAVEKSERGFEKELDAIKLLITNQGKAQDQQIRDLKDRQSGAEGKGVGLNQAWLVGVAALGILISIAILIVSILPR